jgi:hypothetical protein
MSNKIDIKFNGEAKCIVRHMIMHYAKKGKRMLDLYGNGESYKLAKEKKIPILSIDDGRDFKNYKKLKNDMNGEDMQFISLRRLALQGYTMQDKFDTMWLDFCGLLNKDFVKDTIPYLPNIMRPTGYLFITLMHAREPYGKDLKRIQIDRLTKKKIRQAYAKENIKLYKLLEYPYQSFPAYKERKKTGSTPMIVYGFKWKFKESKI